MQQDLIDQLHQLAPGQLATVIAQLRAEFHRHTDGQAGILPPSEAKVATWAQASVPDLVDVVGVLFDQLHALAFRDMAVELAATNWVNRFVHQVLADLPPISPGPSATTTLPVPVGGSELTPLAEQARAYAKSARAAETWNAYNTDWRIYATWCAEHGLPALPPTGETISLFLTAQSADHAVATLRRYLATISTVAQAAGHPPVSTRLEPLKSVWAGIRRTKGTRQVGKAPAVLEDMRRMVATCDRPEDADEDRLIDSRDRALLLLGFSSACRRSELVGFDVRDVQFIADGALLTLRRSKTDQEGEGREIPIPWGSHPETCPVRALRAWLEASGIQEGPLFRSINRHGRMLPGRLSDKAVALIVKARAEKAGLDASGYAGHSLRSGHATTAGAVGVPERQRMTGLHRGSLFADTSATRLGL